MILAVGDSSRLHAEKLMNSSDASAASIRGRWDVVAARVLPCSPRAHHLELFATIEQASLAAMSLLRGMAAVIPPLLSRASPSSVTKHIAAFISTLPCALNPAAMETAAALLSNILNMVARPHAPLATPAPHPFPMPTVL